MPQFPQMVAQGGPDCEVAQLWRAARGHLEAVSPDVLVVLDSDHLATFFYDNLPTFSIGVAPATSGPSDDHWPLLPSYTVEVEEDLGRHLHASGLAQGFDLAQTQEFTVDHSVIIPLHFLSPAMDRPIVPAFVNGLAPPLPLAHRCYALGQMLRQAVERWPTKARVAFVASGSFALEVAGPRVADGMVYGVPDPDWVGHVCDRLQRGEVEEFLEEATSERMLEAGNTGGELLNWIVLLGAIGSVRPSMIEPQRDLGHAFGAWRWD